MADEGLVPCRFFQIGTCRAGGSCRFSHTPSARLVCPQPCRFFAAGYCAHGEQCAFAHDARATESERARGGKAESKGCLNRGRTTDRASSARGGSASASSSMASETAAPSLPVESKRKPFKLSQQTGFASDAQIEAEEEKATWIPPSEEELRMSRGECCAICLEPVLQRGCSFGLLDGCAHVFCLPCIRKWRETHAKHPEVARSCPTCRTPSHFVIPSSFLVSDERKPDLIRAYQQRLRTIPCRRFAYGEGRCPFGSSCFCKSHACIQ